MSATVVRCNDPGCRGRSCTVATLEGDVLVIQSRHHGERHVARIDIRALASTHSPIVVGLPQT